MAEGDLYFTCENGISLEDLFKKLVVQDANGEPCLKVCGGTASLTYDPDAQLLFDAMGDVPLYAKDAWNARVIAFKANGTWTGITQLLPFLPTESLMGGFTDAKTLTKDVTLWKDAGSDEVYPYHTFMNWVGGQGASWRFNGFIKSGWFANANWALNNSAYSLSYADKTTPKNQWSFGVFTSATESTAFRRFSASNIFTADMYGSVVGASRAEIAGVADRGTFLMNRQSNIDYKVWFNGVAIATNTGVNTGVLPITESYFNKFE